MDREPLQLQADPDAGKSEPTGEEDSEAADQATAMRTARAQIQMRFGRGSVAALARKGIKKDLMGGISGYCQTAELHQTHFSAPFSS